MGRPRKNNKIVWEQSVKELLATHDINPLDELLKIATEKIEVHDGDDIEPLMESYELIREGDRQFLRPKLKMRVDIFSELAQYVAPKLRSTETKGTVEYNFNLTIRNFDADPAPVNRVIDVTPKEIAG